MVEQRPEKPCVGSSILPSGKLYRELAQMARALVLGTRGREFESRIPEFFFGQVAQLVRARL